ncbi:MAG: AAA family ATPase [Gemmatimonadaceae bacterium]|nr:AAA family ATPase [Gemmatimonadaceae bacterium]
MSSSTTSLPLRSLRLRPAPAGGSERFPYSVPAIRTMDVLDFPSAVTFFVGENGSGKSTLLEAVAAAAGLPAVGSEMRVEADETLVAQRSLAASIALSWRRGRARRGFFLRAEDFFGFTKTLALMRAAFVAELAAVDEEYRDRTAYARALRRGPIAASLHDMEARYGIDLDANSHGQSFLKLFQSRFVPGGLYLLDEPEAPLSPQSQLALMAMLKEMIAQGSQFIIATHSPILLAFPDSTIYSFDALPVSAVPYGALEHVALTRDFLASPDRFLRHL